MLQWQWLTGMYYALLRFWQNLAEFYRLTEFSRIPWISRIWQNSMVWQNMADCGRLWQIAAKCGLMTGPGRWVCARYYGVVL